MYQIHANRDLSRRLPVLARVAGQARIYEAFAGFSEWKFSNEK